jgi:hypothetical protein
MKLIAAYRVGEAAGRRDDHSPGAFIQIDSG